MNASNLKSGILISCNFTHTDYIWDLLAIQGQKILKEGKTLETAEENIAELTQHAQDFLDKRLKILKSLQIA